MVKKCWFTFVVILFFLARAVYADIVGSLTVHVQSAKDGTPISKAKVTVQKVGESRLPKNAPTDENGDAVFHSLSIGEYEVGVESQSWSSQFQSAVIRVNANTEISFELEKGGETESVLRVSSKRILMNAKDTTGSSTVRNRDFIETRMANTASLNAVADHAPGVDADSQGQIHFRGEHRAMTLEMDGVLLPVPLEAQIGSLVDPRFLEAMEVRTGSFDPTYSGALGGVLNLVTRSGGTVPYFEITPRAGDHGQIGGVAMLGGGTAQGDFSYFVGDSINHTNLRLEAPNPNFQTYNNQGDDENALVHLSWEHPNDKLNATFATQNLRVNIPNTPSEQAAGVNQWQRENNIVGVFSWRREFTQNLQGLFGVSFLGSHQGVGNNGIFNAWVPANPLTMPNAAANSLPANPEDPGNPFLPNLSRAGSQKLLSAVFTDNLSNTNTLRFGGSANFMRLDDNINILDAGGAGTLPGGVAQYVAQDHRSGFSGGMFVGDSFNVSEKLSANVGIRADRYNNGLNVSAAQVSPLFNFSYAFSPTQALRWSYDRTFTAPPLEPDPTGNSRVIPQKTAMYELSYEDQPSSDFIWKVGAYEKNYRDFLDIALLVPLSNLPVFVPDNFPSAQTVGFELSAMTEKRNGLNWYFIFDGTSMHILQPQPGTAVIPFVDDFENQIFRFGPSYAWKNGAFVSVDNKYGSGIPQGSIVAYNADGVYPFGIHGRQSRFITDLKIGYAPQSANPNSHDIGFSISILNLLNSHRAMELLSDFSGTRFVQERQVLVEATAKY